MAFAVVSLVAEHLLNNIYPAAHYCITLETCFRRTKVYKNEERLHTLDCYHLGLFLPLTLFLKIMAGKNSGQKASNSSVYARRVLL